MFFVGNLLGATSAVAGAGIIASGLRRQREAQALIEIHTSTLKDLRTELEAQIRLQDKDAEAPFIYAKVSGEIWAPEEQVRPSTNYPDGAAISEKRTLELREEWKHAEGKASKDSSYVKVDR